MKPIDGGNVEQPKQPALYERIGAVDVSKTDTIAQELSGISNDVNKKISEAFSETGDGGVRVTKSESASLDVINSYLCNLNNRMRDYIKNANDEIKVTYNTFIKNVSNLITRLTDAANGKNPDKSYQPKETDDVADAPKPRKIPLNMPWSIDQADMKDVYNTLMNPIGRFAAVRNKPQAKIGAIEGFIREYRNRLSSDQKLYLADQIENYLAKIENEEPKYFETWQPDKDNDRAKKYWQEYKKAGYSNDIVAQLMVYGYSKSKAQAIRDGKDI